MGFLDIFTKKPFAKKGVWMRLTQEVIADLAVLLMWVRHVKQRVWAWVRINGSHIRPITKLTHKVRLGMQIAFGWVHRKTAPTGPGKNRLYRIKYLNFIGFGFYVLREINSRISHIVITIISRSKTISNSNIVIYLILSLNINKYKWYCISLSFIKNY